MLMTPAEIGRRIDELASNDPVLVTVSGGNPALQPLAPLIELGHAKGHTFALETQGSVSSPWFTDGMHWMPASMSESKDRIAP
jgi:7-carboxy-7-deazaguanine synthase